MIIHSDVNCSETNQYEVENNCLVCHDKIKEEDKVVLKCGHKYHYNCIFMTFKSNNNKRECPYCRKDGGYLKLKDGMIPFLNIHREFDDYVNGNFNLESIKYIPGKCKQILKTGKNAGTQCKNKHKPGEEYCGKHLKK